MITLGEGWTPLLTDTWDGMPVLWKLDTLMPTGSYKDRGVCVMVNWLAGLDVQVVVDDSSGNAGASLACYAARAGMDACIFVPESAPEPKRAQVAVYGADLVEVPGPRKNAALAARAATLNSHDTAYASHAWHPAFLLGQMTCAWEIWEQLGGKAPDWLIAPTGHGGTLLGAWRGFQHLQRAGLIDKLPRLVVGSGQALYALLRGVCQPMGSGSATQCARRHQRRWNRHQPSGTRCDIVGGDLPIPGHRVGPG